jgi:hypothetical protein
MGADGDRAAGAVVMSTPGVAGRRAAAVDTVHRQLTVLAELMFALDGDGDVAFVRSQDADGMADRIDALWERFAALKERGAALDEALVRDDDAAVDALLATDLAGDATAAGAEADDLLRRAKAVAARARDCLAAVDDATRALRAAEAKAAELGATTDPAVAAARAALDALVTSVAEDATAAHDTAPATGAVAAATARVAALAERRAQLPAALADADRLLEEIRERAAEGATAADEVRRKIGAVTGLLQPVDVGPLDHGDRALGPWLDRIRHEAAAGDWQSAAAALSVWRTVADGWLTNVRTVADANRAPLVRRAELRGLLEAYQAKAAAGGREDPALGDLHQAAFVLLYGSPCDLDAADRAVRAYVTRVNDAAKAQP